MASNKQQWNRAEAKWRGLLAEGAFSVWPSIGRTAIICTTYSSEGSSVRGFRREAYALADNMRAWGHRPDVILGPTAGDITTVIKDPNVVSIYTIGDGTLSSLILGPKRPRNPIMHILHGRMPPNPDNVYAWGDVSAATDHLKLGIGVQRQSGLMQRRLNVPLLLPVMADHRSVMAYLGLDFQPRGLGDPINHVGLVAVSLTAAMTRPQVDDLPNVPLAPWSRYAHQVEQLAA